jgi:hypothetical protein
MLIKVKFIVNYFRSQPANHCSIISPAFRDLGDMNNKMPGPFTQNDFRFNWEYNYRIA